MFVLFIELVKLIVWLLAVVFSFLMVISLTSLIALKLFSRQERKGKNGK